MAHQILEDRRYFRIGEASRIVGVEPYVLRYWEAEFPQIRPKRADSNQRTYQRSDIEILLEIKRLLYDEKMTIAGAKQRLKQDTEETQEIPPTSFFRELKKDLQEVLEMLA